MARWFRHYAGMARDDKLVRAAVKSGQSIERVVWIWAAILESAAEENDGGRYDLEPAEIAYFLRADEADIRAVFDALAGAGHLADGAVVKWSDRQFDSDRSAARQSAYRRRKMASGDSHADDRQAAERQESDVTPPSPRRHGDVTVAKSDVLYLDTDTDTRSLRSRDAREPEIPEPPAGHPEPEDDPLEIPVELRRDAASVDHRREFADRFWPAYPHKVGKPAAERAFLRSRKRHALTAIMDGLARYVVEKPADRSWLNPATFLNQERFNDEPAAEPRHGTGPPQKNGWSMMIHELESGRHEHQTGNYPGPTIDATAGEPDAAPDARRGTVRSNGTGRPVGPPAGQGAAAGRGAGVAGEVIDAGPEPRPP